MLRVATLNLWSMHGDWTARRRVLAAGFRQLSPDLIALQETVASESIDSVADILGGEYVVAHSRTRAPDGVGVSIASRWPIEDVREVDLQVTPRTADFPCAAVIAEVSTPQPIGPVLFVNHFPSWQLDFEHERELQAAAAAQAIEATVAGRDLPVIVAGDLDADPGASSIRFWTGRQALAGHSVCYRDAWESLHGGEPGDTYTPENPLVADPDWPFRRIDYVLVRCGLHGGPVLPIASCERIFDAPVEGVWASDHFGVMADLEPRRR